MHQRLSLGAGQFGTTGPQQSDPLHDVVVLRTAHVVPLLVREVDHLGHQRREEVLVSLDQAHVGAQQRSRGLLWRVGGRTGLGQGQLQRLGASVEGGVRQITARPNRGRPRAGVP